MAELIKNSFRLYKDNLAVLAIPFIILIMSSSLGFAQIGKVNSEFYKFSPIYNGKDKGISENLTEDDQIFFHVPQENGRTLSQGFISERKKDGEIKNNKFWIRTKFKIRGPTLQISFSIYNQKKENWLLLKKENIVNKEVNWEKTIIENTKNYYDNKNRIKLRFKIQSGNKEFSLSIDYLTYASVETPTQIQIWSINILFVLAFIFCFTLAIVVTKRNPKASLKKLRKTVKETSKKYPYNIVVGTIPIGSFLLYLHFLGSAVGVFLLIPALLIIFSFTYVLHEITVTSTSLVNSLKNSATIAWDNLVKTGLLLVLLAGSFFLLSGIPLVGPMVLSLFIPFWIILLTYTYINLKRRKSPN